MYENENEADIYQGLFANPIDFSQAKKIILKLPPQYQFTKSIMKTYKGKGTMQITMVKPTTAFIKIVCQSLQNAYIILIKNTLEQQQEEESEETEFQNTKIESSLMESSESFISYNASDTSYSRRSSISSSHLSQIFENLSEEHSDQITFSSNHT